MKKVKLIMFNWRQVGSIQDRDGAGENYDKFEVGVSGITEIQENEPCNGMQLWNYIAVHEDGRSFRVFNPNFIEYFN